MWKKGFNLGCHLQIALLLGLMEACFKAAIQGVPLSLGLYLPLLQHLPTAQHQF